MRIRYASYSTPLKWALRAIDGTLALRRRQREPVPATSIRRILLANQAHLGDAILATAVIAPLREAFPEARLGFLVHPDSRRVVEPHPDIDWVHSVEHWHLNRAEGSLGRRIAQHRRTSQAALQAIRSTGYQLAIDLHPYFPNSIPLLRRSGIAWLVGWSTGGFGPLLDEAANDDSAEPVNMLERHARLLRLLGIETDAQRLRPRVALPQAARDAWQAAKQRHGIGERFVALHVGAHVARRRWPMAQWAETAAELSRRGLQVVLLGHGEQEVALCASVHQRCAQAVDLSGRLEWTELVAAVADCTLLISHDSAPTHLAAGFDKPRICIATGIHDLRMWLRASPHSIVATEPVPCAPCGRVGGCSTMACIRGVPAARVVDAALQLAAGATGRPPDPALARR